MGIQARRALQADVDAVTSASNVMADSAAGEVDVSLESPQSVVERERWPAQTRFGSEGRYLIEAPLESGGFGQVYLARDMRLNRLCVAKRLLVGRQHTPALLASIEREAQMLVALNAPGHPHIPEIYDYVAEQCCLVMKHIAGQSLAQLAARQGGHLATREALRYTLAVAEALAYLHSRSPDPVLHRDIKPANILLDETGRIWLIDFGFSRSLRPTAGEPELETVGTLGYTPPEQWRGAATPHSDIYALGATLMVLLTGYSPGQGALLELARGDSSFPPARQLDGNLDQGLEALLLRMLALEPVARPSAAELLAELARLLRDEQAPLPARRKTVLEPGPEERAAKEAVAALINRWSERSGLRKQHVSNLAGFATYAAFYRAYLDMSRGLNADPDLAIKVVQVFAEGLPPPQRCSAEEAVAFLIHARLPIDRLREVAPFFAAEAWNRAIEPYLGRVSAPTEQSLLQRLDQIAEALEHAHTQQAAPSPQAAAEALLATLPVALNAPLPEPGPLPAAQRMPLVRNPLFVGRGPELRRVVALLHDHPASGGGAVAITGMGGIGKTNLASELAQRYGRFFAGGIFWLNCAEQQNVATEVAECGRALFGDTGWDELPLGERVRRTRAAWQEPLPRLLIFDNCEQEELLMAWRPTAGGTRLLLTSRRADWPRALGVVSLALEAFTRDESLALLGHYRPDLAATPARLDGLAAELGDLPLALHLAGSFLENYRGDEQAGRPSGLLDELRAAGPLAHEALQGIDVAPSATGHDLHIGRTFAVSLRHLDQADANDSLARALLARAARLAPGAPWSRGLLALMVGAEAPDRQRAVTRAARRLLGLGLLAEQGELLYLHPLLAAYARQAIDEAQAQAEVEEALITQAERTYEHEAFVEGRLALPHMQWLADGAGGRTDERAIRMWNSMPFLLDTVGDRTGGLRYLERALSALVEAGTLESMLGAEVLNNLGASHADVGNYAAARNYHERALAVRQQVLPAEHPEIAQSYNNLGHVLIELGELALAHQHIVRAAASWAQSLGPRDFRTLAARNNLGLLLLRMDRFAEAREQFATLLPFAEEIMGTESVRVAMTQHNLGSALLGLGELGAARQYIERSMAIMRAQLGAETPELFIPRYTEAVLHYAEGQQAVAMAALQALVSEAEASVGPEHPAVQRGQAKLAAWLGNE